MNAILDKLPTILTLAVLVGIFLALQKHSASSRTRLWTFAWALIFVHFLIQVFETHTGTIELVIESIDLASLELSGVVFVVSMARSVENHVRRTVLLYLLAVPTAFHATAITFGWPVRGALVAALAVLTAASVAFVFLEEGTESGFARILSGIVVVTGAWAIHNQWLGSPDFAANAILTLSFGVCGPLFWKRVQRWSPGVAAVAGGFVAWGAVFPVGALVQHYYPALVINGELWNVPKFFVAIGMVLTALEDQSLLVEQARARERAENLMLHRLSKISSRLIAGRDPATLCEEIVEGITSTSSFRGAALFFVSEDRAVKLACASGVTREVRNGLDERTCGFDWDSFEKVYATRKLSNNSIVLDPGQLAKFRRVGLEDVSEGCVVLIPLVSSRGAHLGILWLSTPLAPSELDESEVAKLEMLAADLGVTMDNSRLHRQLVRSEKLASLGQLVGGVAHELNNPLTGILGYSELLAGEVENETTRARLGKIGHEARRMHNIVNGLLRFARQSNPGTRVADLAGSIRDVVQLREYHLRKFGIQLQLNLEGGLPQIAVGDDDLKQVLLNVLNNAIDAVENSETREIRISAARQGGKVAIQIEDTGAGFRDLNRAFDPFYSTKPVGKGTGLGLSVCYGIVQEAGGEMTLSNGQARGASVVIEIPAVTAAVPSRASVAVPV
ncbi:MAG TPA: ATP-binding protein [Candidatus Acidoferrales bacterium]